MNKYLLLVLLAIIIVVFGFDFLKSEPSTSESFQSEPTSSTKNNLDIKAEFEIYTKGTKRIFTDAKYHNQSVEVFIEASDPKTVNVRKEGITWQDFFNTLPMKLTKECLVTGTGQTFCTGDQGTLIFKLNDVVDSSALDKTIKEGDRLVVTF